MESRRLAALLELVNEKSDLLQEKIALKRSIVAQGVTPAMAGPLREIDQKLLRVDAQIAALERERLAGQPPKKRQKKDVPAVLVLCQRKTGPEATRRSIDVADVTVPKIRRFIEKTFRLDQSDRESPGYTLEFLTDELVTGQGTADHIGALTLRTEAGRAFTVPFVQGHSKSYALIVLNTCPFILMDYQIVADLLRDDGMIALTSFQLDDSSMDQLPVPPAHLFVASDMGQNIYRKNLVKGHP